ncbi:MAG: UDP-galactopyranose mutase [Coriobacteriia bacterium]|nr:UDP-galactopyranose mutase [Coriobacteriia bacterium]
MSIYLDDKNFNPDAYDVIAIGAGYSGSCFARAFLDEHPDARIAILERRPHIGGNAFDEYDAHGVLIHTYGPHIFHTHMKEVYDFLSRFTEWIDYEHRVLANIHGKLVPVPFNRTGLEAAFGKDEADELYQLLVEEFGDETKVAIAKLMQSPNEKLQKVANYIYEHIFLYYTMKMWGKKPEEIDGAVTARVPIYISRDDRYFQDAYQGLPREGYTKMFERILDHEQIDVFLQTDVLEHASIKDERLCFHDKPFKGIVVYSAPLDELFDRKLGALPYRSIEMHFEYMKQDQFQSAATVNYTTTEDFTRITEFKLMTGQEVLGTTILKEYPRAYNPLGSIDPYYPIQNEDNQKLYEAYRNQAEKLQDFYVLGRLGEYRYYDMDDTVKAALDLASRVGRTYTK